MKHLIRRGIIALVITAVLGCAGTIVVRTAPPSARVEVKPAKPGKKAVWIPGHWKWNGHKYIWKSGHWSKKSKGRAWVPGHWSNRRGGHVWVKGHWKKR